MRPDYERDERERGAKAGRRRSLVANLTGAASPVAGALDTIFSIESPASADAPENEAAMREQAHLADSGLGAVASAMEVPLQLRRAGQLVCRETRRQRWLWPPKLVASMRLKTPLL